MIVNKPEQRGVMTFLKRVLLLSTPWPVQRPAKWLRWALLSHWTQTVFPMKKSKQILSLNNFIQFFLTFSQNFDLPWWRSSVSISCLQAFMALSTLNTTQYLKKKNIWENEIDICFYLFTTQVLPLSFFLLIRSEIRSNFIFFSRFWSIFSR